MDFFVSQARVAKLELAPSHFAGTSESEFVRVAWIYNLNTEIASSSPLLPTDRKWAIRFNADGTVTIVLGMRDMGRGWFSPYFAGLVAAHLGVPFRQIRVYYSATLPAVLQTPTRSPTVFQRCNMGPVAGAVADMIEAMCDRVLEKGRLAFAAIAGIDAKNVGFNHSTGRFFVVDEDRSSNLLEIVEAARAGLTTEPTQAALDPEPAHYRGFAE